MYITVNCNNIISDKNENHGDHSINVINWLHKLDEIVLFISIIINDIVYI